MTSPGTDKAGFGLVELILYIGILTLILTSVIQLSWSMIYSNQKIKSQQELNQNLRLVSEKINYEIRNAAGVLQVGTTKISLSSYDNQRNPTEIRMEDGKIKMGFGNSGSCPVNNPCDLTSNKVKVTQLAFENLSTGDTRSININYYFEIETLGERQEYKMKEMYKTSMEVRAR